MKALRSLKPVVVKAENDISVSLRFGCVYVKTRNGWLTHELVICSDKPKYGFVKGLPVGEFLHVKGVGQYFDIVDMMGVFNPE